MSRGNGRSGSTLLLVGAVTALALLLRLLALWRQPPTVDDQMVLLSAVNYIESGQLGPTMWNHPGLRNILAYGMLKLFGSGQVGTLGLNVLFGTLCTPLIYAVGRRLTGSRTAALAAALIWGVEPLAVEYSRQAINDVYLAFFPLAGILAAWRYLESDRAGWLVAAGAAFGLGLASKWSALFQLAVIGCFVLYRLLRERREAFPARLIFVFSTLVVLPLTIYLATFAPWFGRGYSLAEWPALQRSMYRETKLHTGYKEEIYGDHEAWNWFLRPGISHEDYVFTLPAEGPRVEPNLRENLRVLSAVANPLVWLAVIPSLVVVVRRARRERSEGLAVLTALLLLSYLPLAVAHRPIWFNTGVVVLPFVAMVVAAALFGGEGRHPKFAPAYLAGICVVSLCLFPLAIGKGFSLPLVGDYLLSKAVNRQGVSKERYEER